MLWCICSSPSLACPRCASAQPYRIEAYAIQYGNSCSIARRHGCGTPRQRPPHRGTHGRGAAGDHRAPAPVPNACLPRLPSPGRTTSPLKHGAPSEAWQSLGLAVPGQGAARLERALPAVRRARDNNSIVRAAPGQAGGGLPGGDRAAGRGCRSAPPQGPHSLWWQSVTPPGRCAARFLLAALRRGGQRL